MLFRMLYDKKLAQASYLIGCQQTGECLIIDPQRDIGRYINEAKNENMEITAITETHIHADFLSGARQLAEKTHAMLYLSDEGDTDWKYLWLDKRSDGGIYAHQLLRNGDSFKVGHIKIRAIHTPGHTPEHLSFEVTDLGGGADAPIGLATGDFVFVGDVGRPDLLETAAGQLGAKEKSAKVLFNTLQWFKQQPDYLQVWPGHGAGSACGKALGAIPQSTVGYEKKYNAAVNNASNESRFVSAILNGQPEPPLYFARMKKQNKEGPALLPELPIPGKMELTTILESMDSSDSVLLDTRLWEEFIKGHIKGALHAPLNNSFPTIVGSYVTPDQKIFLLVDDAHVQEAVIDLIRIGLDNIVGYSTPDALTAHDHNGGRLETIQNLAMETGNLSSTKNKVILDVRRRDEYESGYVPGAINIAHTRLLAHLKDLPKDKTLYVHCRSGSRSRYATAFLNRNGFKTVHLDGGFLSWQTTGGEILKPDNV